MKVIKDIVNNIQESLEIIQNISYDFYILISASPTFNVVVNPPNKNKRLILIHDQDHERHRQSSGTHKFPPANRRENIFFFMGNFET